jgi:hypothetical protein
VAIFTLGAGNAKLDLERVLPFSHPISFRYQETLHLELIVPKRLVIALNKKWKTANSIELQGEQVMPRILLSIQHINARNVLVLISLLLKIIVSKHVLLKLMGVLIQLLVMFKL